MRRVPAVPGLSLPSVTRSAPTRPILAGSASLTGAARDLTGAVNLAAATAHAAPVISQGWNDREFRANTAGFVDQLYYRIPYLSAHHSLGIFCGAWAESASGNGELRFTATGAGTSVTLDAASLGAPIGALGWYGTAGTAGNPHLSIPFGGAAYDEIRVDSKGDIEVHDVLVSYLDLDMLGTWPAADGELPTGPFDGVTPFDTADVQADAPCGADLGTQAIESMASIAARLRVYKQFSAVHNGAAAHPWMAKGYTRRVPVPVLHDTGQVEVHIRAENTDPVNDLFLVIEHGPDRVGLVSGINGGPFKTKVVVPAASAMGWLAPVTVDLSRTRDTFAPRAYAGLTTLGVNPGGASVGNLHVAGVSAWGL